MTSESSVVATTVRVRLRPSKSLGPKCLLPSPDGQQLDFCQGPADGTGKAAFAFDKVYDEKSTQAAVFQDLAFVVDAALAGYNGAVLAYGQTGAGKTHTLFGAVNDVEQQGVVPRAIAHLGKGIAGAARTGAMFKVTVSIVEIYCERIRCLLDGAGAAAGRDNLQVKTDAVRGMYVEGATEVDVCGEEELSQLMTQGLAGRSVAATNMNAESSRSHCVVTIRVEQSMPNGEARLGKLVLVDLAGSERAGKTGAQGTTLAEGALINKSLSCLANVIYALTEAGPSSVARHVPYRDSKLTRLLQDSLADCLGAAVNEGLLHTVVAGPRASQTTTVRSRELRARKGEEGKLLRAFAAQGSTARTVLIICCHPDVDNASETLSTLRFGARAKGLTCKLQVNQRLSAERLQVLLAEERSARAALAREVAQLKAELQAAGAQMLSMPAMPATELPSTRGCSAAGAAAPCASNATCGSGVTGHAATCKSWKGISRGKEVVVDLVVWVFMALCVMVYMAMEDVYMHGKAACRG